MHVRYVINTLLILAMLGVCLIAITYHPAEGFGINMRFEKLAIPALEDINKTDAIPG